MAATVADYGSWRSSLSAADLVAGAKGVQYPCWGGGYYVWQESRPSEQGKVAVVARPAGGGEVRELIPPTMSARTMVHEYGGRAWASLDGQSVVFANMADQQLWTVRPGVEPVALTPPPAGPTAVRFGAPALSPDGRWAVCVRERHLAQGVVNDLVAVGLAGEGGEPSVLAEGHDFYSGPVFSPGGDELAFTSWAHPDMPWDRTQLWRGVFRDGALENLTVVVPFSAGESVVQPRFSPTGELAWVSDRTGWWNIYVEGNALAPMEAEFAGPSWALGDSNYAFLADGTVVAIWVADGRGYLGWAGPGSATPWPLRYTAFADLAPAGPRAEDGVLVVAAGPDQAAELVRVKPAGDVEVVQRSRPKAMDQAHVSVARSFVFPTGQGERAFGLFYPPHNPEFAGPEGQDPPLIVSSHGGPTSAASSALNLRVQYWTTRGFAFVDVDYRGSTGYGRAYRRSLDGRWGEADVEDCAAAARWLGEQGWADAGRAVIRGGSSSGLTAMSALARYDIFAAATVLFGVGNLATLAADTHKFESRYIERLVPADQIEARSPVNMVAAMTRPVLFLQGLDDKVVPPEQSRSMARALRANGTPAYLVELEGEGHGFRRSANLVRAQEIELAFYARVLGFTAADDLSDAYGDLDAAATDAGCLWS